MQISQSNADPGEKCGFYFSVQRKRSTGILGDLFFELRFLTIQMNDHRSDNDRYNNQKDGGG